MYENLVFSGGAVYGYTYVGGIQVLAEKGYLQNYNNFIGTSIGGAIAGLLACGASADFISRKMIEFNVSDMKDNSKCCIMNVIRLVKKYGYYKGDKALKWYESLLKDVTGNPRITFKQAFEKTGKRLVIIGTSLNKEQWVAFSKDSYPDMEIRVAVRISISIPFAFKAVKWDGDVWVDGGIMNNYPICYFDPLELRAFSDWDGNDSVNIDDIKCNNLHADKFESTLHRSLGFKAMSDRDYKGLNDRVTGAKSFVGNLFDAVLQQASRTPLNKFNQQRTILINAGKVSSMNFNITNEDKKFLIEQGRIATTKFVNENILRFTTPNPVETLIASTDVSSSSLSRSRHVSDREPEKDEKHYDVPLYDSD